MRFPFNDRKTAQAAAFLVERAGETLNYMVLIKLLYLADREMLLAHGVPITGDRMFAMKNGPVLSRVLDFINEGMAPKKPSAWFEYIGPPSNYCVSLLKKPDTDELSKFEIGLLSSVFDQYGRMDRWDLVDLLHRILPEWNNPGSSTFPIQPEDILRKSSRSEDEIQEVQRTADELWFLRAS